MNMENYNGSNKPWEDEETFKKAEQELKALVRKSEGKDENLTKEEFDRRQTLYQVLKPGNKDHN